MEIEFIDETIKNEDILPREIEEAFEDPFAIRLLPSTDTDEGPTRYYALGASVSGKHLMIVFWSNGTRVRIIYARAMTDEEKRFYDRKYAENL